MSPVNWQREYGPHWARLSLTHAVQRILLAVIWVAVWVGFDALKGEPGSRVVHQLIAMPFALFIGYLIVYKVWPRIRRRRQPRS